MGGPRTSVIWHPHDRHPPPTTQKPSIAWQILLRGLLEGVHSSCKSYLVCTPGFAGQGFILIFKTSCFKTFALFWPPFIFCPWTHATTVHMIRHLIANQRKHSNTLQISTWVNKQPHIGRRLEGGAALGKGKNNKLRGSLPLLWTNHLQGCSLGSMWERRRMHTGTFQLTVLRFQRSPADTQESWPKPPGRCEATASMGPAVSVKNCKDSYCLSLLRAKMLAVLSGPAEESACARGRSHRLAECNREIGTVDPGRKWKNNRKKPVWHYDRGKGLMGPGAGVAQICLGVRGNLTAFHQWKVTRVGC